MKNNQQQYIEYVKQFAEKSKSHIWLGGSFLHGDATPFSDVDISVLGNCNTVNELIYAYGKPVYISYTHNPSGIVIVIYEDGVAVDLEIIEKMPKAKFDETVELHVKLGVDSKHADQQVRGTTVLPNGTGKTLKVLVFAKGPKAEEAVKAGADFVGAEELIPKIEKENWFDYDVIVATPDMMGVVGRLGKVLGPKGLMPNPKSGTVTMDVTKAINEIKSGKVEYRLDKTNIIHLGFGKVSFGATKLLENYDAIMGAIIEAKPAAATGQYIKSVAISTTMGPSMYIDQK